MNYEQQKAADPTSSIWVSASAGTGKTKILTDRVLRLLLASNDPSKILCLTFTKAAAAEMYNRINDELATWITLDRSLLIEKLTKIIGNKPDEKIITLARRLFILVIEAPEGLKIQTIHSFCQYLLQKFPIEASIPTNYQVLDSNTAGSLLKQARINLLSSINYQKTDDLTQSLNYLAWNLHENNITQLIQEITDNQNKFSYLFNNQKIDEIILTTYLGLGLPAIITVEELDNKICQSLSTQAELIIIAKLLTASNSQIIKSEIILNWLNLSNQQKISKLNDYIEVFITKDKQKPRKLLTKDIISKNPQLVEFLNSYQNLILTLLEQRKSLKLAIASAHLLRIAEALLIEYKKLKIQNNALDYNDLIDVTNQLLNNPAFNSWVLYKLDGGLNHILIDEAQDTSFEQWNIIKNLTAEFFAGSGVKTIIRTLFVVGDEKQSIFSFQGADPLIFTQIYDYYQSMINHKKQNLMFVKLNTSYRSTDAILILVDDIFNKPTIKQHVSNQVQPIEHQVYRTNHYGRVELWPLLTVQNTQQLELNWTAARQNVSNPSAEVRLAQLIAQQIKDWLVNKRPLLAKNRVLQPGDIMILLRKRNIFSEVLIKELKKRKIPIAGIDRLSITSNIGIMDLISLGNFLLLPQDDLNFACLLKSPLIGLSEDELLELAARRQQLNLWQSLKLKRHLNHHFKEAYEYLKNLMKKNDFLTPFNLYSYVINVQDGRKKLATRLGLEINDPLDEFLNLAIKYEENNIPSLQGFLVWLTDSELEVKRDLEQAQNQLKIMTIHSSKGLQAPLVILPDVTSLVKANDNLLWDEDNNLILYPGKMSNYNDYCHDLNRKQKKLEQSEYHRLLYVALTRAEDELIICGYQNKQNLAKDCWYELIKDSMQKLAKCETFIVSDNYKEFFNQDEMLVIESGPKFILNNICNEPTKNTLKLPAFIDQPLAEQPKNYIPIITPSRVAQTQHNSVIDEHNFLRGKLIHKLLQYTSINQDPVRFVNSFLSRYKNQLNTAECHSIKETYLNFIQDERFKFLFGKNSAAEVAITGKINNKYLINAQVDRLIVKEDQVIIVDYKTNATIPNKVFSVPKTYLRQLACYRALIRQLYPNKQITCVIIWLNKLIMMNIDDEILDKQLLNEYE